MLQCTASLWAHLLPGLVVERLYLSMQRLLGRSYLLMLLARPAVGCGRPSASIILFLTTTWCAGDQASHLLWRLQHGDTFTRHPPVVAVVMIGTNDLGAAACLGGQAAITRAANGTAARCGAG